MARAEQVPVRMRIVIESPVAGVWHSLQSKDGHPLDAKVSSSGEPLMLDFPIRTAPGPKFFGDQVRREGPQRRFIYVCVGQLAGDRGSPWTRRMKIDIHDIEQDMIDRAVATDHAIRITVAGTAKDGSPSCATVKAIDRCLA